ADFAVWQREWLRGELLDAQVAYWKQQLSGAPAVLTLPSDRPRPAMQSYRGGVESRLLPRRLIEELQALCQQEGATLFMGLLGAFQMLLSRHTGETDIVVGTPVAGRSRSEL